MDAMIQSYMEETEDMLQRAEECIIRLETEFSSEDINELFRLAHSIKGASHMVGYEDIGNLMHKIEDMLDMVRNGSISFNQDIVSLCFDGLDIVKKILETKVHFSEDEFQIEHIEEARKTEEKIQSYISASKKRKDIKNTTRIQEKSGLVSALLNKKPKGKNKYYVTVVVEEDAPMVSPVFVLILNSIQKIGTLLYSSVTDDYFLSESDKDDRVLELILCTDIEEAELYAHFDLFYVEKINIINLNRNVNEINDYYLNETDYSPYLSILKTVMELYRLVFCNLDKTDKIYNVNGLNQMQTETKNALGRLRNKVKAEVYNKEFNELFNLLRKIRSAKAGNKQKIKGEIQDRLTCFIDKLYQGIKGKYIVRYIKLEQDNACNGLKNFMSLINKSSTLIFLINISTLDILRKEELYGLIKIKNELKEQGIEIGLITNGACSRKIINIFDSIRQVENFRIYSSELEAITGMFHATDSYKRITDKISKLNYESKGC